jgi:multiple sugar transport system ATP-binding protein
MAFGLRLRKTPEAEIKQRVGDAAALLRIDHMLQRKPRELSGGQRQRVAMGRAIVREPQAFLMDEPLSNLDAKLRVQMRAEIARIQHELDVTTVYVTHDQTEAMTMGDRVAVIRKGELQQVDSPQTLYEHPLNIFVAGFIGSPAMNLLEATLQRGDDGWVVSAGDIRLELPKETLAQRAGLAAYDGKPVVLGIRPEDMEDASLVADAPAGHRLRAEVDLREALGSDVIVHFGVAARPAVTEDVKELAVDVGVEALQKVQEHAERGRTNVVARLNPRTRAEKGDTIELVVDTTRLHFFDADTGAGIYSGESSGLTAEAVSS